MKILAIESSCDETAAAVIGDGAEVLSNVVVSQVDIFAAYGGVIPEVAARSHLEAILPVVQKALDDAGCTKEEIDYIAVTYAPGLLGSLLIGTLTARMLAILWGKPLYAVHHLKAHIYANWLAVNSEMKNLATSKVALSSSKESDSRQPGSRGSMTSKKSSFHQVQPQPLRMNMTDDAGELSEYGDGSRFPLVALVVSGGHTQIIYMPGHNQFEIIGTTRDDAVGECFDKVAKILGLPYPGGPSIAKCAAEGRGFISSSEAVGLSKSNPSDEGRDFDSTQPKNLPQIKQNLDRSESSATELCIGDAGRAVKNFSHLDLGDRKNYKLPHPKVEGLDFSFSGLKTAVLRAVQAELGLPITTPSYELAAKLTEQQRADFAASFQETACEILLEKLEMALEAHPEARSVVFAGGVSANQVLRQKARERLEKSLEVYFPEPKYAGDNAAMVGVAAYFEIMTGVEPADPYNLDILPRTPIK